MRKAILGDLYQLGLSKRAYNALVRAGIWDIARLATLPTEELLKIRNLGEIALVEIQNKLSGYKAVQPPTHTSIGPAPDDPTAAENLTEPQPLTDSQVGKQLALESLCSHRSLSLFEPLTEREHEALELRYGTCDGESKTLDEVAQNWGLTRERVRQILAKATTKLSQHPTWLDWQSRLQTALADLGGLANEAELSAGVEDLFVKANLQPLGLVRLLADISDAMRSENIAGQTVWKLTRVWDANGFYFVFDTARDLLVQHGASSLETVFHFIQSHPNCPPTLTPEFARAVLRVHPKLIREADGTLTVRRRGRPADSALKTSEPVLVIAVASPLVQGEANESETYETESEQVLLPDSPKDFPELAEWEERLQPQLRRVGLVGEIRLTTDECTQLGALIGQALTERRGRQRALHLIERHYPATFLVFLVAQGVHGYKGGDYWSGAGQSLGIQLDANWHSLIGQLVERLLTVYGLPLFPEMRAHAARYLSLVLAHGGIPTYCLGDYFQNVIRPALHSASVPQSAETLLTNLLQRSAVRYVTDRPVLYFLENGGGVAVDFFQRSCELAREWQSTQALPTPEAVGLPEHVVAFFQKWGPDNLKRASREPEASDRFRPPELQVDPWGDGLRLHLPAQPTSALADIPTVIWIVQELDKTFPARISFGKTQEINLPLRQPHERYTVSLHIGEQTREWTVDGYDPQLPLMIFNPQTGRWQARLTPTELWLFYPRTHTLEILEGQGHLAEELPILPGGWLGQGWDLSAARIVGLKDQAQMVKQLPIRSVEQARPVLVGEPRWPASDGQPDIYVGTPPAIRIPLTPGWKADRSELERWQLNIRALDEAIATPVRLTLLALDPAALNLHEYGVEVNLAHPTLLGPQPLGTFNVKVSGPIGRDGNFTLGCVPVFESTSLEELLLPEPQVGPSPLLAEIQLTEADQIELNGESRAAQVRQIRPGVHQLKIPGHLSRLTFTVTREIEGGVERSVSLTLPLRRAQWRLTGNELEDTQWSGRPLRLPLNHLFQQPDLALLIDLPGVDADTTRLNLRLINIEGDLRQTESLQRHRRASHWRCDLARFHDTLRMMRSPYLRFELEVTGLRGREQELRFPVLELARELEVEHIHPAWQKIESDYHLRVTWNESMPLRSRVLYLWPVWRPWETPLKLAVPDAAQGTYEAHLLAEQVPPGRYRLSFAVVDPWHEVEPPIAPPEGSPSTVDLPFTDVQSRLAQLEVSSDLTQAFVCDLERAYIRHISGLPKDDSSDVVWCCQHIELAGARQLVALYYLIHTSSLLELQAEVVVRLFEPDQIQRLVNYYHEGQITANEFGTLTQTPPPPEQWQLDTCVTLTDAPESRLRLAALRQLAMRDLSQAVPYLIRAVAEAKLSEDEFVQLLSADKYVALEVLETQAPSPLLRRLIKLLEGQSILVHPGMWLECNVGYGQIKRIEDAASKTSVDQFFEDDGAYRLHMALHVALDFEFRGENVVLDMQTRHITFPRTKSLFLCHRCGFASAKLDLYRSHLQYGCGGAYFVPPQPSQALSLTRLKFFHRSAQPTGS